MPSEGQGPAGPSQSDPEVVADEILALHPEFTEVPKVERDEDVPPRPEEEIAASSRSEPDL